MEYIIIKLYTNEMNSDLHDINIDASEAIINEMTELALANGRRLFFAPVTCGGGPISCTPFAEIEYTGELADDETKRYIDYLKRLSADAEFDGEYLNEYSTLEMVRLKKIDDAIITL